MSGGIILIMSFSLLLEDLMHLMSYFKSRMDYRENNHWKYPEEFFPLVKLVVH